MDTAGKDAVRDFEKRATIDRPSGTARYEVISQPDSLFIFDDVEDVLPVFANPAIQIIRSNIGYHVGEAAFTATGTFLSLRQNHEQNIHLRSLFFKPCNCMFIRAFTL